MSAAPVTRPPDPTRRSSPAPLAELDGLRAVAAGAVVLTHAGFLSGAIGRDILPGFLARMDIGVAVFFVLSGFLLYRPYARVNAGLGQPRPVRVFFAHRAARLVPAWLLVLAGTPLLVPAARESGTVPWLANLVQLQGVRQDWIVPGLAQLWSLSTEVMFYLSLPVLAVLLSAAARRHPRGELLGLAALVLGSLTFRALVAVEALPVGFTWLQTLPATLDWFVAGMLLACVAARPGRYDRAEGLLRTSPLALWTIAACVLWVLTTRLGGPYDLAPATWQESLLKHLGYGVIAFLVVAPATLVSSPAAPLLTHPVVAHLGRISYGVFLWHLPLMFAVRDLLGFSLFGGHFWVTLLATVAATVVVASVSWRFVEEPVQRWVRTRTRTRTRT